MRTHRWRAPSSASRSAPDRSRIHDARAPGNRSPNLRVRKLGDRSMATYAAPVPQVVAHDAKREPRGWTSWMTTTDHKRIGIMYMVTTFVFFVLGGVEALLIRLQLG